jgi:hypothetical protein
MCMHSEHQARTTVYKDPTVSVRKSQDCGKNRETSMLENSQKGNGYDAPMEAPASLISRCDTL